MSEPVQMTHDAFEALQSRAFRCGELSGMSNLARYFRQKSGEQFARGERQVAESTLQMAEEMESETEKAREKFNRDYPPTEGYE